MKKLFFLAIALLCYTISFAGTTDSCGDVYNQVVVSLENSSDSPHTYYVVAKGVGANKDNTVSVKVTYNGGQTAETTITLKNGEGVSTKSFHNATDIEITNRYCLVNTK
ncbi:MAG: hypothetical protein K2K00_07090 [Muribaculaceae bacterium]|nr:hypothetical protein [Muribaculaceae bacterium]MDE6703423.1 hypothetical protein [Muribaculaceae bacterium]